LVFLILLLLDGLQMLVVLLILIYLCLRLDGKIERLDGLFIESNLLPFLEPFIDLLLPLPPSTTTELPSHLQGLTYDSRATSATPYQGRLMLSSEAHLLEAY